MHATSYTIPHTERRILQRLYRLNRDSELGFETVAGHVKNRALKILLKTYASQRAQFAADLLALMEVPNGTHVSPGRQLAALHRGWIDIKAAMTIGRESVEQVVLAESARGETVAVRAYHRALQTMWPGDFQQILQHQASEIEQVRRQIQQLAGKLESQSVVQLFDSPEIAQQAIQSLADVGIPQKQIQLTALEQMAEAYQCHCQRQRVLEPTRTGMLLGVVFGAVVGLLAGVPIVLGIPTTGMWETAAITTGIGLLAGGLLGGLFGLFIGLATTEDDAYLYAQSLHEGDTLLTVQTSRNRTPEVRSLLSSLHRGVVTMA